MVSLDASTIQAKVREYRESMIKEHIESRNLTQEQAQIKRDIIEIGLQTMEYALSDFTLKVATEIKTFKTKFSVYASIAIGIATLAIPFLSDTIMEIFK